MKAKREKGLFIKNTIFRVLIMLNILKNTFIEYSDFLKFS